MSFSPSIATRQLLFTHLLLVCVWASESSLISGLTKLQFSLQDALCSMPYGNLRVNIYEHYNNHKSSAVSQKRFFYDPIALLDHKSADMKYNNVTKLGKMRFRIEMWSDHFQREVVNYLNDFVGQQIRSNQVQVFPFTEVILSSTNRKSAILYSLPTDWHPYRQEKSLWFSLECFDLKDCNQLKNKMHQDPIEFEHLKLLYSLSFQPSQTKQISEITIGMENIFSSQGVRKLLRICENAEYVLITTEEENRILSETTTNVILESFDKLEVVSSSSELQIYKALKNFLAASTITISKENYNLEEPLCWNDGNNQTDKRLKQVSGKHGEDNQSGEEWSEINENIRTENIPNDIPDDEVSISVAIFKNVSEDIVDKKSDKGKSITLSKINLGKLRNRLSTDDQRLTIRYSTAVLSTFVQLVQSIKLSNTEEWDGLKKEFKELKTDHHNLKIKYELDQQNANTSLYSALNSDHRRLKTDHHVLKADTQKLKSDYQNLKADYLNLKTDHQNFKLRQELDQRYTNTSLSVLNSDYQYLRNDHQILFKNHGLDIQILNTKLSALRTELEDSATPDISFRAVRGSPFSTAQYVPYERVELNNGNGMNGATEIFTAPRAGTYLFTFHARMDPRESQTVFMKVNGLRETKILNNSNTSGNSHFRTSAMSVVLSLNVGDKVGVYLSSGALRDDSYFSGILVRESKKKN